MLVVILYLTILFIIFIVIRPLIVFLHEMGHAVPSLLFTKGAINIYIGSYGDPNNSIKLKVARLTIWYTYTVFPLYGLCVPGVSHTTKFQNFCILIGGPIASLIIASITAYLVFRYEAHGLLKYITIVFSAAAVLDLMNLIPSKTPIRLYDGTLTYNDGQQIRNLLKGYSPQDLYQKTAQLYKEQRYDEAITIFEDARKKMGYDPWLYDALLQLYVHKGDYATAEELYNQLEEQNGLNAHTYAKASIIFFMQKRHDKALELCNKALELDPNDQLPYLYLACVYNQTGKYEEALLSLDEAMKDQLYISAGHSYKAYSYLRLGDIQKAEAHIQESIALDSTYPDAHKIYGLIWVVKKDYEEALKKFLTAKEKDNSVPGIDKCIEHCKNPESVPLSEILS